MTAPTKPRRTRAAAPKTEAVTETKTTARRTRTAAAKPATETKPAPRTRKPAATPAAANGKSTIKVSFGEVEFTDYSAYAAKVPTQQVQDWLTWLQAVTGVQFKTEAEMKAAYLASTVLRFKWQEAARNANSPARKNK